MKNVSLNVKRRSLTVPFPSLSASESIPTNLEE